MKLYLVGSRARNAHNSKSDFDYLSTDDLDRVIDHINYKKIIKHGSKYVQLELKNGNKMDIWRIPKQYIQNTIMLRSMDKGHYIGFVNAVKKLGFSMNFFGIKLGNDYINPKIATCCFPELNKFDKYLNYKPQYITI